ncbi:MAG TPA: MBL fold metallo-hydrolase, partial [Bacillota bacterium]|nr:MBL fold metallo-hydrolase [Bacillota bacterium]
MIIKVLAENTTESKNLGSEHGLSLFIRTKEHNILFDVGASELFYQNAEKLGVDISDIDYLIISHGHYDHGGGLKKFLEENTKAEIFLHKLAFEKYYARDLEGDMKYIGLDQDLKTNRKIVFTSDRFFISKGIQLFSNVMDKKICSISNSGLLMERNGKIVKDVFAHEQNLIIEEDGITLLLTGCSHNGIVNIIEHFYELKGSMPDYVIGGFHLFSRSTGGIEDAETIDKITEYLSGTKTKYYTCHCTGTEAFEKIKLIMGVKIE